jgi:hypothetical protein
MDEIAKKTALRMIPYDLFVLTARGNEGKYAAASVNWVIFHSAGRWSRWLSSVRVSC